MESSSSQPVSHSPHWANNGRSPSAASADPLAFFDLIMSSAKAMSAKGNSPLASSPTSASDGASSPENRAETSNNDSWSDDSSRQAAAHVPAEAPRSAQPSDASPEDAAEEDVAAVTDLSEDVSPDAEATDQPDEAAEATAAAAGTGEQLLAAPDTLTGEGEEAMEPVSEEAVVSEKKPTAIEKSETGRPIDTDAPLDTSSVATEGETESDPDDTQATSEVNVREESSVETQAIEQRDELDGPQEEVVAEPSADVIEERSEHTEKTGEKTTEEVDLEAESSAEAASDEVNSTSESSSERDDTSRRRHDSKVESKSPGKPSSEPINSAPSTTTQVSTAAAEAVAAASSATGPQPSGASGPPTSGSNNVPGVNNLASLLQRGLQRGTLQKSTESKSTPQLDPKQQIRLINRVARAVESTPAGQSIKIRLNPSELGQLKVEITIEKGNMVAKIEAENPATRQVLMQHLPQLRDRLAENNINIQQFDVDLMGQQSPQDGGTTNLADQQQQQHDDLARRSSPIGRQGTVEEEGETAPEPQVNKEAERDSRNLNVTI